VAIGDLDRRIDACTAEALSLQFGTMGRRGRIRPIGDTKEGSGPQPALYVCAQKLDARKITAGTLRAVCGRFIGFS
jgi:hypothetical protein